MRNTILAAFAVAALVAGASAAKADEFGQRQANAPQAYQDNGNPNATDSGASAYLDQQAVNSELSDPTAPNSIRSHGHN